MTRRFTEHSRCEGSQYIQYHLCSTGADTLLDEELTFIHPNDVDLYNQWDSRAFELQVANHELLGHGSGKLFQEDADGKKNFDPEKVLITTCAYEAD
jgi:hypothetical protein